MPKRVLLKRRIVSKAVLLSFLSLPEVALSFLSTVPIVQHQSPLRRHLGEWNLCNQFKSILSIQPTYASTDCPTLRTDVAPVEDIVTALEILYPATDLNQRIALSRKDGYWPFIQKGEEPPQALVYGEFDLQFFGNILERAGEHLTKENNSDTLSPWKDKVFCDLGSGTGRLVLAAAALHPWRVCRGVELLEGIHHEAVETLRKCCPTEATTVDVPNEFSSSTALLSSFGPDGSTPLSIPLSPIELRCGSFDDPYEFFGDADLLFVFSTCMDSHVLTNLARAVGRQCQPGCLVLTTEYKLPMSGKLEPLEDDSDYPFGEFALELLESVTGSNQATGGESTVHIHRVTKALGNGSPRSRPELSVSDVCYHAIKAAEDPSVNDAKDFLRRVSNQMAFVGLPESWRPKLSRS
jgi:hypothetical protein